MRLMPTSLRSLTLLPVAALAITGCTRDDDPVRGETLPITHASAHADAIANVRAMLDVAWKSEKFLAEAETLERASAMFSDFAGASDDGEDDGYEDEDEVPRGIVLPLDEVDFDETKRSFQDFLEDAIFREEQIESTTADSVTYRLNAELFCEGDEGIDADCVESFDAVQLRVVATSVVEGDIDLAVLSGAARHEIANVELHADLLAVTLNVGPVFDAAVDAVSAMDPESEAPEVVRARGSLRASMRRLSTDAMRMSVEIVSPIEIEVTVEEDELQLEAGAGLVALDVDAGAGTAVVEADLRDASLQAPKRLFGPEECYDDAGDYIDCPVLEGSMSLTLERLAGLARLIDTADRGTLEGVIAGPFTAKIDDVEFIKVTLNDETAPIDVLATTTADLLSFTVDGPVRASALIEMRAAAEIDDGLASGWYASDFLTATMAADQTKFTFAGDGMVIDAGTIAVSSRSRPDLDATFSAGQCVIGPVDSEGDEPHPFELTLGDTCFAE